MESQQLYRGGAERWGTDEEVFTRIFATRSPAEIAVIADLYKKIAELIYIHHLKKNFQEVLKKLFVAYFMHQLIHLNILLQELEMLSKDLEIKILI